ncbi:tetratricopeptide repeat protein [Nitrospira defluvii]|nr:tetratricopeptide repeat protein [Nitrospira defluvii]
MKEKGFFRYSMTAVAAMWIIVLAGGFDMANAKATPVLEAPAGANDEGHNAEGIKHYNKGHWKKAEQHFRGAVESAPKLAEAHYNLALSLDKRGNHREATKFFGSAFKLAPDNPSIAESKILKDHLGM